MRLFTRNGRALLLSAAAFMLGCGGGQEYDSRKHSGRGAEVLSFTAIRLSTAVKHTKRSR